MTTTAMPKHRDPLWPTDGRNACKQERTRVRAPHTPSHVAGPHIIDASQANKLPTGRVVIGNARGVDHSDLASLAGYCSRHWGYHVDLHDDGNATVHLYND